jgi:predicted helicase
LYDVPPSAWEYKLGKRSALEWVLEQYKESTPLDATVASKFNTYRFSDHKEAVIKLLARVTTVSVETQKIVAAMRQLSGSGGTVAVPATPRKQRVRRVSGATQ